jgi:hypothetical protein
MRQIQSLNLRLIPWEEGDFSESVLIEGDKETLEWFGNLLIEHAKGKKGCGLQLHPNGPGNKNFARTASIGIYLHRLPCDHPTAESERLAGRRRNKRARGRK